MSDLAIYFGGLVKVMATRRQGIESFYGKNSRDNKMSNTRKITVHVEEQRDCLATDVTATTGDVNLVGWENFRKIEITLPQYKEEAAVTSEMLEQGLAQYRVGDDLNPDAIRASLHLKNADKCARRLIIAERHQVYQGLLDGVITFAHTESIDLKRDPSNTVAVATAWNKAGADIYGDLNNLAAQTNKGYGVVDTIIFGEKAWALLIKNEAFRAYYDIRNATFGSIMPQDAPAGLAWQGFLYLNGIKVNFYIDYTYYIDQSTGQKVLSLDQNAVVAFDSVNAYLTRCVGSSGIMPETEVFGDSVDGYRYYVHNKNAHGERVGVAGSVCLLPLNPNATAAIKSVV